MTESELYWKIARSVRTNVELIRKRLPYRTGNLAYRSFKCDRLGPGNYKIYIDLEIAPYAYYLDVGKPIGNSDKHKGFWDARMKELMNLIAQDLGAEITTGGDNNGNS